MTPSHPHQDSGSDTGLAQMRAEFERWFSDDGESPAAIARDMNGNYRLQQACSAWQAWQAAWNRRPSPAAPESDAAWVERLRDTARHLRENSLSLAKYPGMGEEARARELAALYIAEIADLHECRKQLPSPAAPAAEDGISELPSWINPLNPMAPPVHRDARHAASELVKKQEKNDA